MLFVQVRQNILVLVLVMDLDVNKSEDAPEVLLVNEFSDVVCGKLYL